MKENSRFCVESFKRISRFTIYISLIFCSVSCHHKLLNNEANTPTHVIPYDPNAAKWLDWNVLFQSGTNSAARNQALSDLNAYITAFINNYNSAHGTNFAVNQYFFNCPCDSLLWNFNAEPIAGSGAAPIKPPNPGNGGGVGGSGDAIKFINENNSFIIDSTTQLMTAVDTSKAAQARLLGSAIDTLKPLAVMDTGLDSNFFQNRFRRLLWNASNGQTIRNFQFFNNFQPLTYDSDDDLHKHGTAVTAIALQALESMNTPDQIKPRIMVLKVLDGNKTGSTFTVSCALSYAVQNHATLINASLGYYSTGAVDSVLRHYTWLCNTAQSGPIPILAAAGNLPGVHDDSQLCNMPDSGNVLDSSRLFFPACFSTTFSNVTGVTGLQNQQNSCFYQNFSSTYVSVGVVTNQSSANCCKFPVSFLPSGYEGSSFATPVVSGEIMGCLLGTPGAVPQNCLNQISTTQSVHQVTVNGRYLIYTSPHLTP